MLRLAIVFSFVTIIFSFVFGLNTAAHAAGCEPGRHEVTVYQHNNYKGACSVLGIGKYRNSREMRVKNDSISSIKLGRNAQITVCNNAVGQVVSKHYPSRLKMHCVTLKRSYKRLGVFGDIEYQDEISSATVARLSKGDTHSRGDCYPGDNSSKIAIYQHPKLGGACRILGIGSYANSKQMNFRNDSVSSIEFGRKSKVYAVLCQRGGFKGVCETIRATDIDLKYNPVGDNKVTSIKVLRAR